jgi:hypothetical protein
MIDPSQTKYSDDVVHPVRPVKGDAVVGSFIVQDKENSTPTEFTIVDGPDDNGFYTLLSIDRRVISTDPLTDACWRFSFDPREGR